MALLPILMVGWLAAAIGVGILIGKWIYHVDMVEEDLDQATLVSLKDERERRERQRRRAELRQVTAWRERL